MIERIKTGLRGERVIEMIPETAEDLEKLRILDSQELLDTRQSLGDGPFKTVPVAEATLP